MASSKYPLAHYVLAIIFTSQVLLSFPPSTEASNILFFIGNGGPSHRLAMQPLANALASKGHSVTFIVQDMPKPDKSNNETIKYVVPEKVVEFFENMRNDSDGGIDLYEMRASRRGDLLAIFIQWFGLQVCKQLYLDEPFVNWVQSTPKFDLVIMDGLLNECGYGIAHAHGAKTILCSIRFVLPWAIEAIGAPDESSWLPDVMFSMPIDMGFRHRMFGAVAPVFWSYFRSWFYLPSLEKTSREGWKLDKFQSYAELERNTSLVFVNTHASQELAKSLPPNVIPVMGFSWVEKRKPLPQVKHSFQKFFPSLLCFDNVY